MYRVLPYVLVGIALWLATFFSGVHTTLAGVLLALAIPTRSPPNTAGLLSQSMSAFHSLEMPPHGERNESRFQSTVRTLETVVERLLSPAQRMERDLQPWSSYLILPLFALANAGIELSVGAFDLLHPLSAGIMLGLVLGKPMGIMFGAWLAVLRTWLQHLWTMVGASSRGCVSMRRRIYHVDFHRERSIHRADNLNVGKAERHTGFLDSGCNRLVHVERRILGQ